jgi:septum formation protein
MEIILASASDRRQELMKRITENFKIIVSDFDEDSVAFKGDCREYVKILAEGKATNVSKKLSNDLKSIIIGCDTIVSINNKVLGKPKTKEEAFSMLMELSGQKHQVYSGIALMDNESKKVITDFQCTDVFFSRLEEEDIRAYIETGDPMDKAGAYGIQGRAGVFVEQIRGCYYNVVGLPLNKLNIMLREMGVNLHKELE